MNVFLVFASRGNTLRLVTLLKERNIPHEIVNTPRKLGRSCGLSVKIFPCDLEMVKCLSRDFFVSVSGFYQESNGIFYKI